MKILKKIILILIGVVVVLLGFGLYIIKQSTFHLTAWEYPEKSISIPQDRPNILLLVAEDMSDIIGAFGNELVHTPNIDELAKIGVSYPNTFTTAGVCAPSRTALITGVHQISIGGQHMRTSSRPEGDYKAVPPIDIKAFPELLRKAGYFTFNTVKQDYQFSDVRPGSGPFTIWDEENNPDLWRNRKDGQPFFGMMNFMETHESGVFTPLGYRPNSPMHFLLQVFRKLGEPENLEPVPVDPGKVSLPPYYPDTQTIREDISRHYENISVMDGIVGDIMERLRKDGLMENTIVIWTTDHGDGLPRAKRELYDSGIKVPMVIYYPPAYKSARFEKGTVDTQMISFVDLAPTILYLAKAPIPEFIQGRNFLKADTVRKYIFASRDRIDEVVDRQRAVRNHRFKYIKSWYPEQEGGHHIAFRDNMEMMKELWQLKAKGELNEKQLLWFQPPGEERLFDLQNDPFEMVDISKDTTYAKELDSMRMALGNWLNTVEDWSEESEGDMVKRFHLNGRSTITPSPTISVQGDQITIKAQEGASIGYKVDDNPWELYHLPLKNINFSSIKAKAVRYGWEESEVVTITKK